MKKTFNKNEVIISTDTCINIFWKYRLNMIVIKNLH